MSAAARVRRWVVPVAVLTAVVFLALPVDRARVDRAVVLAAVLVVCFRVLGSLGSPRRPQPAEEDYLSPPGPPDQHVVRLARLEAALSYGADSQAQYDRSLRPQLRQLLDDRLALRHGITLVEEPVRCRGLMDEELWRDVVAPPPATSPSAPGPTPARVARLLDAVERI